MTSHVEMLSPAAAAGRIPTWYLHALQARQERRYSKRAMLFLLAHPLLAAAMQASALVSTLHAMATMAVALYWVFRSRRPEAVVPVFAYIVGSEVIWRGTDAAIFWESGKYALAALSMVAIFRFGLFRKMAKLPLIYLLFLLPSLAVLPEFDRGDISFNLSGPLALALTTSFVSSCRIRLDDFKRLLLTGIAPIFGLVAIASISTLQAGEITFAGSTRITSAGIGPNQVSSVFGLGTLLAVFYLLIDRRHRRLRIFLMVVALWMAAQSALTFSRGGLATFVGAIAAASFFLLLERKFRGALILRWVMLGILILTLVFPALDSITGGAVGRRFSDPSLTGRDKIIEADLIAFQENPILGTGPGRSKSYHALTFRISSSHTEYSRMLAEHGSFGLVALLLLLAMSTARVFRRTPLVSKAFSAAMTTWALLYMFHSAMRLAAPAFIFALGAAVLVVDPLPKNHLPAAGWDPRRVEPPPP